MLWFVWITSGLEGPSWSWSYGSWIYNYLCNQCLSPLKLWVRIPLRRGVLDTTLCDQVCQWLAPGRWFSPGTPTSSTNKTHGHDITKILLKVALNTITLIQWITYQIVMMNNVWEEALIMNSFYSLLSSRVMRLLNISYM